MKKQNNREAKRKRFVRITAAVLAAIMVLTALASVSALAEEAAEGTETEAVTEGTSEEAGEEAEEEASSGEAAETDSSGETAGEETSKEETVYVIASPDGTAEEIISSSWLKNPGEEDTLTDSSILTQIENLKGEESFTQEEDGTITWDAKGKDIYYRADADSDGEYELPVTVTETFYLDGEEMTAEEITGKSGRVTIRFDYTNTQTGEDGLHVPFAALTGILLDDDRFSDPELVNAWSAGDGEHTVVIGAAFPGLAEDLASPAYKELSSLATVSLPDHMEFTADMQDFEPLDAYTVITGELFGAAGSGAEEAIDKVDTLLSTLAGSVGQIADGVGELKGGADELKNGASDLAEGLGTLSDSSEALNTGAQAIFSGLLDAASSRLAAAGAALPEPLTAENYQEILAAVETAVPGEMKPQVEELKTQLQQTQQFCESLSGYTAGVEQAKDGADTLKDGISSLQGGAMKLSLGTGILRAAIPDLSGTAESLKTSLRLAREYNTWSGIREGTQGTVRFIWVTR